MRVTYLRLENVAGLIVGSNLDILEIDFTKCKNNVVAIQAPNGYGKSVLLSSIHPFAYVGSLDDRSNLNYIATGKNGYKEIHYDNGGDQYVIKHYYKANRESHSIRSYISKNGEELNENGNVRSFISLVEIHLGLTEDMMRLIRLGSNVHSFISLAPARRKEYIGNLIDEIDLYLQLYKGITDDMRTTRAMVTANATNIYNCHITDPVVEEEQLKELAKKIKSAEEQRDEVVSKIGQIEAVMRNNDVNELRRKHQDAAASMRELEQLEVNIRSMGLENTTVEQLITQRSDIYNDRVDIQAKINSYRLSIDHANRDIERIDIAVKRITSSSDIDALLRGAENMRRSIGNTPPYIVNMPQPNVSSQEVEQLIARLNGFNHIAQMIYSLDKKSLDLFLKLKHDRVSVDWFLRDQQKKMRSAINREDLRVLMDQMFADDEIISPNCATEFQNCPYYRFADTITKVRDKLEEETFDGETLRYLQVIANNIDGILNEMDQLREIPIPGGYKVGWKEDKVLERLRDRVPLFETTSIAAFLSSMRAHEIFRQQIEQLRRYEEQITMYRKSGVDAQIEQTKELRSRIDFYQNNISVLEGELQEVLQQIESLDAKITLVSRYTDAVRYRNMLQSTIESTSKLLGPLETAEKELQENRWKLKQLTDRINDMRSRHRDMDSKLQVYHRLVKEEADLKREMANLTIIQESASTKKGIPVVYMKRYLGRIRKVANQLLDLIYEGDLRLAKFNITQDSFEVPFVKNGAKLPDVKHASQSEVALITMALSFALMKRATGSYNVLLLDEIDAGLDDENRAAFLKMLGAQMATLKAEQVFMVSHNMSQMINIPMDVIRLGPVGFSSKMQNVIYDAA